MVLLDGCHPSSFPHSTVYLILIFKIREAEQIAYVAQIDQGTAIMIDKQTVNLVRNYDGRIITPYRDALYTE